MCLPQTQASYQQQIDADNSEATATQARITTMQNNLTAQMTQADATIAALQSQVTYFTTLASPMSRMIRRTSVECHAAIGAGD